ncbi:MAG: hypothetical protein ACP5KU_01330 [Candidatus Bathyarchaeia archaeon]
MLVSRRNLKRLKGKAPQLLVVAIIAVAIAIVLLDTLEDTLVEGGQFAGAPLAAVLNTIVSLTQNVTATISSWGSRESFC